MISGKKRPRRHLLKKAIIIPAGLLLFAFTINKPSFVNAPNDTIRNDTLPQTEIVNLKRADIYVVITDTDMVKIRLKNRDSIMMSRTNFDALPQNVRKEISANNDGIFSSEQIESTYPGGPHAWLSFLNRTFRYPQEAVKNRIQGTVVVQFIVNDKGKVSNIEAVSGPDSGGLKEETIRVIERSGRWNPAIWNGYKVTSYKRQPLTFRLE